MTRILFVVLVGASLVACKTKNPAEAPTPAALDEAPPPAPPPEPSISDEAVLAVFRGNDVHAMAGLGHDLETKRPPLSLDLVKQMLTTLRTNPGEDEQSRKMHAALFMTVAVNVGRPALPLLSDCVAMVKELSKLCGTALQEIQAAK